MKKCLKFISIILVLMLIQSCMRTKVVDVKSPCVSTEEGPCGVRKPINTWLSMRA